ncbi:hypothetical protein HDK90DRAFT_60577 [Phyllosticta capitalensis]|uniref:Uncharacterized protein n=1 Tax=Phyllosticta capitalensis TaxID=121624 RepID=A0ABR1YFE2_9PEZI
MEPKMARRDPREVFCLGRSDSPNDRGLESSSLARGQELKRPRHCGPQKQCQLQRGAEGAFKHAAWTPNLGVDICFIRGASAPARLQQAPARHHTPTSRGDDASPRPTDIGRQPRQRCQSGRGLHSTALRMTRPSSPASNGGSNESFFSTNKSACSCVAAKQSWRPRANPTLKPTSGANKSQGRATLHSPANVRDPSTGI